MTYRRFPTRSFQSLFFLSVVLAPLLGGLGESSSFAKTVVIQWKEIDGAAGYELQVQGEQGIALKRTLRLPKWSGEMKPGAYSYKIRGIDGARRPGIWSPPSLLAILPPSPNGTSPKDGATVKRFNPNIPVVLKWDEIPGVKFYSVEIKQGSKVIAKERVLGNRLELKSLPSGKYSWTVASVLKSVNRSPAGGPDLSSTDASESSGEGDGQAQDTKKAPPAASAADKEWETKPGSAEDFTLEQLKLAVPEVVFPKGVRGPPEDGKIKLKWKEVEGAQLYEVQFGKMHSRDLAITKRFVTANPFIFFTIQGDGEYSWSVRALADLDEHQVAQTTGPETLTSFILDRNATFRGDLGYVSLTGLLNNYNYQLTSPLNGITGTTAELNSLVYRLSGEFWFKPQWALGGSFDYATFSLNQQDFVRNSFELFARYRLKLGSKSGWSILPKLGMELRTYNEITPTNTSNLSSTLNSTLIASLGATAGVEVRDKINDRWTVGARINYFIPAVILSGVPSGSGLSGGMNFRNVSAGAEGEFSFARSWSIEAGAFYELRSISFKPSAGATAEQIAVDGYYFFGSIVYHFGK
jgi:hypothetical protein